MIHNNELEVSNLSYTKLDFPQIYPELLDLTQTLTDRWNPAESNESDPAVVLLKENAFLADKENYNIDKNVLEAFMPSATQKTSMQDLCAMNGYNMKYYNSATLDVVISYSGTKLEVDGSKSFVLPKFTTTITNDDNSMLYTLLEDCTVAIPTLGYKVAAIQGTIETLTVGTTTTIKYENIDDNYRLYLPTKYVAENGIFINNVDNDELWSKSDHIHLESLGTKCFELRYDSREDKVYIQFPTDIASVLGNGIIVRYTITQGKDGNIATNTLTKLGNTSTVTLVEDSTVTVDLTDDLTVSNLVPSTDGTDPETVEQAYNNFKKTVATFDTLVTARDYENYFYYMKDSADNVLYESNGKVGDRRTDINHMNSITTYNEYGPHTEFHTLPTTSGDLDITPYDLCIYPLSYAVPTDKESYAATFKPLENPQNMWDDFETRYETIDCISHDYKEVTDEDIYAIKNYYTLRVQVYTYNKVNKIEQNDIISNIKAALYAAFNSRNVDYGYEIPYDTLRDTIINADSRIKTLDLPYPDLETKVMLKNGKEYSINETNGRKYYINFAAINILNARLSLFDINDDFTIQFGQGKYSDGSADNAFIEDISSITTDTEIDTQKLVDGYTLRDNECIQIIQPSLYTEVSYPEYVAYWYTPDNTSGVAFEPDLDNPITFATDAEYQTYILTNNIYYRTGSITGATCGYLITADGDTYEKATSLNGLITVSGTSIDYFKAKLDASGNPILGSSDKPEKMEANKDHQLTGNEQLRIYYTDSSNYVHLFIFTATSTTINGKETVLTANDANIFRPSFDLEYTSQSDVPSGQSTVSYNGTTYYVIGSGQTIDKRQYNKTTAANSVLHCYWIRNNSTNTLFERASDTEADGHWKNIILDNGEYFIYTDSNYTQFNVLGSGTMLSLAKNPVANWSIDPTTLIDIDDIATYGLDAFNEDDWYEAKLVANNLTITQLDMTILGAGTTVWTKGTTDNRITTEFGTFIHNEFVDFRNALNERLWIEYLTESGADGKVLQQDANQSVYARIRTRLDLVCGPSSGQQLQSNETIKISKIDITTGEEVQVAELKGSDDENRYFEMSIPVSRAGGKDLDMTSIYMSGKQIATDEPTDVFCYTQSTIKYSDTAPTRGGDAIEYSSNEIEISLAEVNINLNPANAIKLPLIKINRQLFMAFWDILDSPSGTTVTLKAYDNTNTLINAIKIYNSTGAYISSLDLVEGMNIIDIDPSSATDNLSYLVLSSNSTASDFTDTLTLRKFTTTRGTGLKEFNPSINLTLPEITGDLFNELSRRATWDGKNHFDYLCDIKNSYAIDIDSEGARTLDSPEAFWDANNVVRSWVIPEIDFIDSTFAVARSSRS